MVHDGLEKVKTNPYGEKAMEVADATYSRFGKPLEQYLQTPYAYAKPYVEKVDSMADRSLDTVDAHFPIVKQETNTVVDKAVGLAMWPLNTTAKTYNYVMDTWSDEYQKTANKNNRGSGVTTSVMAIVSTELKIASDCLQYGADVLARRDNNDSQVLTNARQGMNHMSKEANNMASQANRGMGDTMDKVQKNAQHGADQARDMADEGMNKAKSEANRAKKEAKNRT